MPSNWHFSLSNISTQRETIKKIRKIDGKFNFSKFTVVLMQCLIIIYVTSAFMECKISAFSQTFLCVYIQIGFRLKSCPFWHLWIRNPWNFPWISNPRWKCRWRWNPTSVPVPSAVRIKTFITIRLMFFLRCNKMHTFLTSNAPKIPLISLFDSCWKLYSRTVPFHSFGIDGNSWQDIQGLSLMLVSWNLGS